MSFVPEIRENQTRVRIAQTIMYGIKKRCRKEERIYIDGMGLTDSEAMDSLRKNVHKEIEKLKSYKFMGYCDILDANIENSLFGQSIVRAFLGLCDKKQVNHVRIVDFKL